MGREHAFVNGDRPNPVEAYLQQLAPGSRRVMGCAVERIADALSGGQASATDYPWQKSTYADALRLKDFLARAYSPATAARHLSAWRSVLREAWRLGLMPTDRYLRARDVRAPRRSHPRPGRVLELDEVAELLDADTATSQGTRNAAMVAILAGCGLRRGELRGLDFDDLDLATGALSVREAKGGKARQLVLPRRLRGLLQAWVDLRGYRPGPLFTPLGPTGRVLERRISPSGIVWAVNRLAAQQGVRPFGPHALRRMYATELVERGVDLLTLQQLMGHANLSTLRAYVVRVNAAPPEADGLWDALVPVRPRVQGQAA